MLVGSRSFLRPGIHDGEHGWQAKPDPIADALAAFADWHERRGPNAAVPDSLIPHLRVLQNWGQFRYHGRLSDEVTRTILALRGTRLPLAPLRSYSGKRIADVLPGVDSLRSPTFYPRDLFSE